MSSLSYICMITDYVITALFAHVILSVFPCRFFSTDCLIVWLANFNSDNPAIAGLLLPNLLSNSDLRLSDLGKSRICDADSQGGHAAWRTRLAWIWSLVPPASSSEPYPSVERHLPRTTSNYNTWPADIQHRDLLLTVPRVRPLGAAMCNQEHPRPVTLTWTQPRENMLVMERWGLYLPGYIQLQQAHMF